MADNLPGAGLLDWAGLMRAGMGQLRLLPEQFWALTPGELALMLGITPDSGPMTLARLSDLAERFPDYAEGKPDGE